MTRRQFISGSLASAALLARGDVTASVDGFAFPDWAVRQIDDGVRRYFDWKGADETVAFPLITDVHSKVFGLPDPSDWRDPKRHVYFMRHIAERVDADFIADLGDHDFQVVAFGKQLPMDKVGQLVDAYHSLYRKEPKPVLFCRGNHDHAKGRIPDADYGARFNRGLNAGKDVRLTLSDDGTFGYLDLPQKQFRTVFLNTSRGFRNGLPAEELQFMADALPWRERRPAEGHDDARSRRRQAREASGPRLPLRLGRSRERTRICLLSQFRFGCGIISAC